MGQSWNYTECFLLHNHSDVVLFPTVTIPFHFSAKGVKIYTTAEHTDTDEAPEPDWQKFWNDQKEDAPNTLLSHAL